MRYSVLACDYDGTLAHHGRVSAETLAALERLRSTGRRLVLVTGRELDELLEIFPEITHFEWVVAENGALLYRPASREEKVLVAPPDAAFVAALNRRGVTPISVGRAIVATWQPHETAVLDAIREQGLELHVIFNKGAVMVLPSGVTKATGLKAALKELGLSAHETVGIGDAENDHAFLGMCECSVAVANALPALKEHVDLVTVGQHGVGVAELIDRLVETDLAEAEPQLGRHHLLLGVDEAGRDVRLSPYGPSVLVAGPSGSGKSTATATLLESLAARRYQFCIVDPEGDYEAFEPAIALGHHRNGPAVDEVLQVLARPDRNVVVNMVGLRLADRPAFFMTLLPQLLEMRARTGRPHWLVIDEAHHLLPASWEPGSLAFPADLKRTAFITVHPNEIHPVVLGCIGTVIAVGKSHADTLGQFCQPLGATMPEANGQELKSGEVLFWRRHVGEPPSRVRIAKCKSELRRHVRKYAEGELPPDDSFYFRGPKGKLNLRAQNLMIFLQLADGVDDATWKHHLKQHDYSSWFRKRIKDEGLAAEAETVERQNGLSPADSRAQIRAAVERRYTQPASTPLPMPGTAAAPTRNSTSEPAKQPVP